MFSAFLIKYGEIGVKGKNRFKFEDALVFQIKRVLEPLDRAFDVVRIDGRILVTTDSPLNEIEYDETLVKLKKVFGIVEICPAETVPGMTLDDIKSTVLRHIDENFPDKKITFKVNARRGNKSYPIHSMEINASVGEAILEAFPEMRVDVHNPDIYFKIDIRDSIYVYSKGIKGTGGLPLGTNGRALLLLSGGIDSPVAGYMISKRGVELDCVYFNAPPYTSDRALQKVKDLARILSDYSGKINLHIINFTDIQLYIYDKCPHDELTIIMRRFMMKIAERIARANGCLGLVTGESIGQVASQTLKSLFTTDEACTMPVYRPLIAFDKQEIVDKSEEIGTYETSILPYEDCCTIFVAKHPVTKPNLNIIKLHEQNLNEKIDELIETALDKDEVLSIGV
ncbi:MAG: tRNA 4-thiouridine(8) synthase ThiI [Lachnospiraceae bacterium]|nr:tRNA 4-thiouridine(8) synthase ThiI [Lachnospiraceae bacterium]